MLFEVKDLCVAYGQSDVVHDIGFGAQKNETVRSEEHTSNSSH